MSSEPSGHPTLEGVPVVLRVSPRARRLRLRVDPRTRQVLLTVPRRMSERKALAWAAEHRDWVKATLAAIPEASRIDPGSLISFRGQPLPVEWDRHKPRGVAVAEDAIRVGGPAEGFEGRVLRWLRREALALLEEESRFFAAKAGARLQKVSVGDPRSRWGSCSSSGNIRYSWRLILAPDFVRRATVAHEVAHLVHMNHGPHFHALVETLLEADAKPARLWLRRNGASLHRLGART